MRKPSTSMMVATAALVVAATADAITFSLCPAWAVRAYELNPVTAALGAGPLGGFAPKLLPAIGLPVALWLLRWSKCPHWIMVGIVWASAVWFVYCAWTNVTYGWG